MLELRHENMSPVFDKWHVGGLAVPVVFHRFTGPDLGDPHDHPWAFKSLILSGGYREEIYDLDGTCRIELRSQGDFFYVPSRRIHRIVELPTGTCETMILPDGGVYRKPGFYQFRDGVAFHRFWDSQEWTER